MSGKVGSTQPVSVARGLASGGVDKELVGVVAETSPRWVAEMRARGEVRRSTTLPRCEPKMASLRRRMAARRHGSRTQRGTWSAWLEPWAADFAGSVDGMLPSPPQYGWPPLPELALRRRLNAVDMITPTEKKDRTAQFAAPAAWTAFVLCFLWAPSLSSCLRPAVGRSAVSSRPGSPTSTTRFRQRCSRLPGR